MRHFITQLHELFKKWPIEIKFPPIISRIPAISKPFLWRINRKWHIFVIHRNNLLPGFAAFSVIKTTLIAENHPALHTTVRTQLRSRNRKFPTTKSRRHLNVKIKILLSNLKTRTTLHTLPIHEPDYNFPLHLQTRHL